MLHARDCAGYTPLHTAAWAGHKKIVQLLILAGADPELLNDDKQRPIDLAKINAMNIKMQLCGFFYNDVNESTMFAKSSHDMLPNA